MNAKYESSFTQRVIEQIENARLDRGMSVQELIERSGIRRSSYFRKMRGDTTFTTEDVDALARAIELDPFLVLRMASTDAVGSGGHTSEPRQSDYARVADEITTDDETGEDEDEI